MSNSKQYKQFTSEQLRLGMYVLLPKAWLKHPFFRNQFLIKTDSELKKVQQCELDFFTIDLSKSKLKPDWDSTPEPIEPTVTDQAHPKPPNDGNEQQEWNPDTLIPGELQDALEGVMTPAVRSQAVYKHSRELMQRLLETPTAENLSVSKKVISSITDLILSDDQTASNMLRITSHDIYTYTHSVNVGVLSIMLAKALFKNSDAHDMHELGAGFFLHDLGKVSVRPEVINKPGRLNDDEMRHMRTHPYKGYKLLETCGELSEECRIIILQHHERSDGTGYPKQTRGDEIHVYGKICCIADVFDALTAERSYKKAMTPFDALNLMKNEMSDHFDKNMFAEFVNLMR
jgi:HD-GYP domain-containing protein (c-di-GMP phosphodiesterase class II)